MAMSLPKQSATSQHLPSARPYQMSINKILAERTTIDEWQQELTPTNVTGMSHTTWPNKYKSPE
jgi:hypothetical protein